MYLFRHTSRGSAILIALVILILITLLTTVFLEKIIGSAKTVSGIESSNTAYYQAVGVIEEQLMKPEVSKKEPWRVAEVPKTGVNSQSFVSTGRVLTVLTGSNILPKTGYGNSPYSHNYNTISLGKPVQIVIPDGIDWSLVDFEFRVPPISNAGTGVDVLTYSSGVILWTLGYSGASLYASGESQIFHGNDINLTNAKISSFEGITNSGSSMQFGSFYTDSNYLGGGLGDKCIGYSCTLKLSMIRPVITTDGRSLPFLEYRITFNKDVPSQFMTLDATAYAYGFQRTRTIRIPQVTTNTALDFAVLQ